MVQTGFLIGIPTTMVEDVSPSLKAIDDAVMDHPKVSFLYSPLYSLFYPQDVYFRHASLYKTAEMYNWTSYGNMQFRFIHVFL